MKGQSPKLKWLLSGNIKIKWTGNIMEKVIKITYEKQDRERWVLER